MSETEEKEEVMCKCVKCGKEFWCDQIVEYCSLICLQHAYHDRQTENLQ